MPIQAAFTSKAVTRIFQRDIASYECLLPQYHTTANKNFYTQRTDRKIKKNEQNNIRLLYCDNNLKTI